MSWKHLEWQPSKRLSNAFELLTLNCPEIVFKIEKTLVFKISSSRLQIMRPADVYTVCLRLLEMLPSKRLRDAFKWSRENVS